MSVLPLAIFIGIVAYIVWFMKKNSFNKNNKKEASRSDSQKQRVTKSKFCGECGVPLEEGDRFCPACGAKVDDV